MSYTSSRSRPKPRGPIRAGQEWQVACRALFGHGSTRVTCLRCGQSGRTCLNTKCLTRVVRGGARRRPQPW